jgi:pimeloyl-ACP methyl ester carboxylesterase
VVEKREFKILWVELNGLPAYAQVSANSISKAKAVVLVHGLGLSSTYLMPTAKALAPYYRVFVPDLPGFGRSGKPSHVADVPELADDLAAWMRAIKLDRAALSCKKASLHLERSAGSYQAGTIGRRPGRALGAMGYRAISTKDLPSRYGRIFQWRAASSVHRLGDTLAAADLLDSGTAKWHRPESAENRTGVGQRTRFPVACS